MPCEIGKRQLEPRMKGRAERPGGEKYVRLEWRKIDEGAGEKHTRAPRLCI